MKEMQAFVIEKEKAIFNFFSNQTENLDYISNTCSEDNDLIVDEVEYFSSYIKRLLKGDTLKALRELFRDGFTSVLLGPESFETLENLSGKDFAIVIKDKEKYLGTIFSNEITW
jgi:hypothetical protein